MLAINDLDLQMSASSDFSSQHYNQNNQHQNRLAKCFESLRKKQKKGLIPFITAGDPQPEKTLAIMHALVETGADIIELGVPFSDPSADGPVIQQSSQRALSQGIHLSWVLQQVSQFRLDNQKTPIVLMSYANPIECMGWPNFVENAALAGIDGVLIVDYPPEEANRTIPLFHQKGIDPIFLLSPTSTISRIAQLAELARGYIYYVSLNGVTGSGLPDWDAMRKILPDIRQQLSLPIAVGFGVRDAATACAAAHIADAVIIGSHIVQLLYEAKTDEMLKSLRLFMSEIRQALDQLSM